MQIEKGANAARHPKLYSLSRSGFDLWVSLQYFLHFVFVCLAVNVAVCTACQILNDYLRDFVYCIAIHRIVSVFSLSYLPTPNEAMNFGPTQYRRSPPPWLDRIQGQSSSVRPRRQVTRQVSMALFTQQAHLICLPYRSWKKACWHFYLQVIRSDLWVQNKPPGKAPARLWRQFFVVAKVCN